MAGTSLLALIDDIASLLDDVGTLSQTAASKTAGVLGDDLALNAEQVAGVRPERELPVVWAVARGSALNKLILVPAALGLSAISPFVIAPLLMLGGGYLCFEGFEKVWHHLRPTKTSETHKEARTLADPQVDLVVFEKNKIKGAIFTDLILSAEIVVIVLGTVQTEPLLVQALVLSFVAAGLTVAVYGLVAAIVKLDDIGLALARPQGKVDAEGFGPALGRGLLWFAPRLLKSLGVIGTAAMFLVGGGIWVHGVAPLGAVAAGAEQSASALPHLGTLVGSLVSIAGNALVGIVVGALAVVSVSAVKKLFGKGWSPSAH